jgi:hypothetical protein
MSTMPPLLLRWILIGLAELVLTLGLASIAPVFINSAYPWLGFLIWVGIIGAWFFSMFQVAIVLWEAARVRRLFLRHFPEERDRSVFAFTGLSLPKVKRSIAEWQYLIQDQEFQEVGLSPLDFIKAEQ